MRSTSTLRRGLARVALWVFMTALLAVGAALAQEPRVGGTLRLIAGSDFVRLDQAYSSSAPEESIQRLVYERLVEEDENGNIIPGLAESWSVDETGTIWTFNLRRGIVYHDGVPFTSAGVKRTFDRVMDPANALPRRTTWVERLESVDVIDDYTIQFVTHTPLGPFLTMMAHGSAAIKHPTQPSDEIGDHPLGTGPYKVLRFVRGDEIVLVRNEDYWDGPFGPPFLDSIVVKIVLEPATAVFMLEAGEVDAVFGVPFPDVPRLQADPDIHLELTEGVRTMLIQFNLLDEHLGNPLVRRAISLALDTHSLSDDYMQGYGVPAMSINAPGTVGYYEIPGYDEYDPEKARELLALAGYPNGFTTELLYGAGRYMMDDVIGAAIQADLAAVGITVELQPRDWETFQSIRIQPAESASHKMLKWGLGQPDNGLFAALWFHSRSQPVNNSMFYSNARVDELIDLANAEPDIETRNALLAEMQVILAEDLPMLGLFNYTFAAAWRPYVHGIHLWPTESFMLNRVWMD